MNCVDEKLLSLNWLQSVAAVSTKSRAYFIVDQAGAVLPEGIYANRHARTKAIHVRREGAAEEIAENYFLRTIVNDALQTIKIAIVATA